MLMIHFISAITSGYIHNNILTQGLSTLILEGHYKPIEIK